MLLRRKLTKSYNRVIGKIRRDLIISLRRKGVIVSHIHVDLKQDNVLLRLSMPEE